jgi:hypothetical protein
MTPPAFLYDDAYITLASAEAVWSGGDRHYPGATPLSGITSPFHLAIVTALLAVLPPEWALLVSCLLGAAAYGAGLWWLARGEGLPRVEAAALVLAACGIGAISQQLVNGLETSWILAAVTWTLVCARRNWVVGLGVCCGTLPFVRPETAVLAAAILGNRVLLTRRLERPLIIAALAAPLPWLVLLFVTTGGIVQTSLAAKRDWYAETCWTWGHRGAVVGSGVLLWLQSNTLLSLGVVGLVKERFGRVLIAAAAATLVIWSLNVPDVLYTYQRFRYYTPFVPLLVLGVTVLPRWGRSVVVYFGAALALVTIVAVARLEPVAIAREQAVRDEVVAALQRQSASRVLVHDIGYLAYVGAAPTLIDMVGLKTPVAADAHRRLTGPTCGGSRAQALAEIAAATEPDVLVVWKPWDEHFVVTGSLRAAGWTLTRVGEFGGAEPIDVFLLNRP